MKRIITSIIVLFVCLIMAGCGGNAEESGTVESGQTEETPGLTEEADAGPETEDSGSKEADAGSEQADLSPEAEEEKEENSFPQEAVSAPIISRDEIPAYEGEAYTVINHNVPYFTEDELSVTSYEYYSELDSLGRCGVCAASVGQDIMPVQERGEIGNIKPTGWQTVKYPGMIEGNYLYNRCHLIGFPLTGENDNERNLITGTRYMNIEGMLPFENTVADFVKETNYHVMYRVTPVFEEDNLVASGVLMEAQSVEDNGKGIMFNVFCYNVQPGIIIDYATGNNTEDKSITTEEISEAEQPDPVTEQAPVSEQPDPVTEQISDSAQITASQQTQPVTTESQAGVAQAAGGGAYAVNGNNGKIHIVGACPATGNGDNAMKHPVYFGTYEEAMAYSMQIAPSLDKRQCGNCW